MGKNTWKTLAIISIIINVLLITGFFLSLNYANESIENEQICFYDICDVDNLDSPAYDYYYDEYNKICYCYDEYNEVIDTSYIN